jgi:SAC3/GANP family
VWIVDGRTLDSRIMHQHGKAKTDKNYARFFSILRSPSTPYLAACLMFKHVQAMRREAFRTCAKTYGSFTREGSAQYDTYPLKRLTALLCFENDDETQAACRHYNIIVKDDGNGRLFISWKASSFREPKDPDKNTVIPLRPLKMLRTIESKLKGATRVAVCRGEVSGEGSHLSSSQIQLRWDSGSSLTSSRSEAQKLREAEHRALLARMEQAEQDAKRKREERELEIKRQQRADQEKAAKEAELQRQQTKLQEERDQKERARVEQERLEKDRQAQIVAQEREAALRRAQELERERILEEQRQENLRKEAEKKLREEKERQRLEAEELTRQAAEKERERREREAELRRQAQERERLELLRQEDLKRQIREAEERRRQKELNDRVEAAKRTLVWRRMLMKTVRVESAERTSKSLSVLNASRRIYDDSSLGLGVQRDFVDNAPANRLDLRYTLELYMLRYRPNSNLIDTMAGMIRSGLEEMCSYRAREGAAQTLLFKVAIVLPRPDNSYEECICGLIQSWVETHIDVERVAVSSNNLSEVRVVFVVGRVSGEQMECDAALLIVPPTWSDRVHDRESDVAALATAVDSNIPRVVLSLREEFGQADCKRGREGLKRVFLGGSERIHVVANGDLDIATLNQNLRTCTDYLAERIVDSSPRIVERWPIPRVIFECCSGAMRHGDELERIEDILDETLSAIDSLRRDIEITCDCILQARSSWPSLKFCERDNGCSVVRDYFGKGVDLPADWASLSISRDVEQSILLYSNLLRGSFSKVIERLVCTATLEVQERCQMLLDEGLTYACLRCALLWRIQADEMMPTCRFIFLPAGQLRYILNRVFAGTEPPLSRLHYPSEGQRVRQETSPFSEQIDKPPHTTLDNPRPLVSAKRLSSATVALTSIGQGLDNPGRLALHKRQRLSVKARPKRSSEALLESQAFTKRLERLCRGEEIHDMMLGDGSSYLSTALEGAPALTVDYPCN